MSTADDTAAPGTIRTVAAVIVDGQGRVLLVRKHGSSTFIQPGGKREPGEDALATLARELQEELGVDVQQIERWQVSEHDYPHALVRLHWCKVWEWTGEFEMREGQAMAWQQMPITVSPVLPGAYPVLQWLAEERDLQSAVA